MLYAIIAAIVLVADQWLKYWVTVNVTVATGEVGLIPGVIKLVNVHNNGAAFGLLDKFAFARWIFLGIAVVFVVAVIVLLAKRVFKSRFANWCIVLAMAGAIGNCIDRLLYGYVVDMFKLEFLNFAIFNVADIVLVLSCLLFIVALFTSEREYEDDEDEEEEEDEDEEDEIEVEGVESNAPSFPEGAKKLMPDGEPVSEDDLWSAFRNELHKPPSDTPAKPAAPRKKPAAPKDEFDLDAIMAEFKDI